MEGPSEGSRRQQKFYVQNFLYSELNAKQISLEIIKRFPAIEYYQDNLTCPVFLGRKEMIGFKARCQIDPQGGKA
jgi:hypothetical protein